MSCFWGLRLVSVFLLLVQSVGCAFKGRSNRETQSIAAPNSTPTPVLSPVPVTGSFLTAVIVDSEGIPVTDSRVSLLQTNSSASSQALQLTTDTFVTVYETTTNKSGEISIPVTKVSTRRTLIKISDTNRIVYSELDLPDDILQSINQARVDAGEAPLEGLPVPKPSERPSDGAAPEFVFDRKVGLQLPRNSVAVQSDPNSEIVFQKIVTLSIPVKKSTEEKTVSLWTQVENLSINSEAVFNDGSQQFPVERESQPSSDRTGYEYFNSSQYTIPPRHVEHHRYRRSSSNLQRYISSVHIFQSGAGSLLGCSHVGWQLAKLHCDNQSHDSRNRYFSDLYLGFRRGGIRDHTGKIALGQDDSSIQAFYYFPANEGGKAYLSVVKRNSTGQVLWSRKLTPEIANRSSNPFVVVKQDGSAVIVWTTANQTFNVVAFSGSGVLQWKKSVTVADGIFLMGVSHLRKQDTVMLIGRSYANIGETLWLGISSNGSIAFQKKLTVPGATGNGVWSWQALEKQNGNIVLFGELLWDSLGTYIGEFSSNLANYSFLKRYPVYAGRMGVKISENQMVFAGADNRIMKVDENYNILKLITPARNSGDLIALAADALDRILIAGRNSLAFDIQPPTWASNWNDGSVSRMSANMEKSNLQQNPLRSSVRALASATIIRTHN